MPAVKAKFRPLIDDLLAEGHGLAAAYVEGFARNRPALSTEQSPIHQAMTAGYNAKRLYKPDIELVRRLAMEYAAEALRDYR